MPPEGYPPGNEPRLPTSVSGFLAILGIIVVLAVLRPLYSGLLHPAPESWWSYGWSGIYSAGKMVWGYLGLLGTEAFLVPMTFLAGRQLYKLRFNRLSLYGKIETVVGCLAAVIAANAFGDIFDQGPNPAAQRGGWIDLILAELGGLYIIVRGFDSRYRALFTAEDQAAWHRRFKWKARR